MAWMNGEDTYQGTTTFETSGENFQEEVGHVKTDKKALTLEDGPLAFWTARVLEEAVDHLVVCDPLENYLISRSARKGDVADAKHGVGWSTVDQRPAERPLRFGPELVDPGCRNSLKFLYRPRRLKASLQETLASWRDVPAEKYPEMAIDPLTSRPTGVGGVSDT